MTDRSNKSSEDLIREAREGLAPGYEPAPEIDAPEIVRPADRIVRPSDRIARPEPVEPSRPPERTPERRAEPEPEEAWRPAPAPVPAESTDQARSAVRTAGRVARGIGAVFLLGALVLGGLLAFALFSDTADAEDILIGGAIIVFLPLAIGIALLRIGRRMQDAAEDADTSIRPVDASDGNVFAPVRMARTDSNRDRTQLHEGEMVLASVKGTHPQVRSLAKGAQIGIGILFFIVFASFAEGFPVLILAILATVLLGRVVTRAIGRARLGSDTPVSMRMTVTDRRVLVGATSFTGTTEHAFLDRSVDTVETVDVKSGDPAIVTLGFTNGDEFGIATSKKDAKKLDRALAQASPLLGMRTSNEGF